MKNLIDNLNAIGLTVIVIDDEAEDIIECPQCGGEMWLLDDEVCEDCAEENWQEENGDNEDD